MFYIELENLMIDTNAYIEGKGCAGSELRKHHPRIFIDSNINQTFYDNCYKKIRERFGYHKIAFVSTIKTSDLNIGQFYTTDKIDWVREHFDYKHDVFFVSQLTEIFSTNDEQQEYLIHTNSLMCDNWKRSGVNKDSLCYINLDNFNKWFYFNFYFNF